MARYLDLELRESQKLSGLLKIRQQTPNGTYAKSHITKPKLNLIIVSALPEWNLTPISQESPDQH